MQTSSSSGLTDALANWDEETGSFTDIDYTDTSDASWQPVKHLDRLATITTICYSPNNSYYQDADLKSKIVKGLNYWYENRETIKSTNWWYNDRDVPEVLASILFFQPEGLGADALKYFSDKAMSRYIVLSPGSSKLRYYQGTGQGVFDRLNQSLTVLWSKQETDEENYYELLDLMDVANTELTTKTYAFGQKYPDGTAVVTSDTHNLKADYSYHEHNHMLLSASYGREFLKGIYNFLKTFKGSGIKLSNEAARELSKILLDGFRWIQYKGYSDPSAAGRRWGTYGSTLKNSVNVKEYVNYLCNYLVENFPDADFIDDIEAELDSTHFSGNRHFWQSDYSVNNRENYHFSVRSTSNRVKTSEYTNSQGMQSRYLGDGMIAILTRGPEYNELGGAYDWNKLPGTTTCQFDLAANPTALLPGTLENGNTSFVGGVSDGMYGMHTFDYNRDGVTAKKSWFMFDDEIVALGSGITSDNDGNIYTSINQTTLNGAVLLKTENADAQTLATGDRVANNVEWVLHDSIGYIFFEPESSVQIKNQSVTGDWHNSDANKSVGTTSTKNIFLLGQSHGAKPTDAEYSYIMLPKADAQRMAAYVNPITVLKNTKAQQAVWHATLNMLQAAFYEAGSVTLPNGVTVSVDKKCALMIKFDGEDYEISISNPENTALGVTVSLSGGINASHSFNEGIGEKGNDAGKTYFYSSK